MKNGIHHVTGIEHDDTGKPSEAAANRRDHMDKRMRKIEIIRFNTPVYKHAPYESLDLLIIGWL